MLTLHLRAFARRLILALTLLLMLQPLVRAESHAATPALSVQGEMQYYQAMPARSAQVGQTGPSGALQPFETKPKDQAALDLAVRLSLATAGWRVTALNSQLDEGSAQSDANRFMESGSWHVEALDEKGLPLTLDGMLNFIFESEAHVSQGFTIIGGAGVSSLVSASGTVTGTLTAPGVEVSLDFSTLLDNSEGAITQKTNLTLDLLRDGQMSTIKSKAAAQSKLVAYNVGRQVITSSLERDGSRIEATQTITARVFGHGESEIWLETTSLNASSGAALVSLNQHLLQRVAGDVASQYLDRFDLTTPFGSYTLKEPGTAKVTAGEPPAYSYVLVDKDGTEYKPGGSGRPPGNQPELAKPGTAGSVLPGAFDDSTSAPDGPTLLSEMRLDYSLAAPPAQSRGERNGAGRTPAQQAAKEQQAAVVGGAAVAVAVVGAAAVAQRAAGAAAEAAAAQLGREGAVTVAGEAAAETEAAAVNYAGGAAAGSAGISGPAALANADPYFVYPDIRPNADPVDPSPIQITRVTGGLVASVPTSTLSITTTEGLTPTLSPGGQDPPANAGPVYDDDPVAYVGGNIPPGAETVGEWTWDISHPYGAIPAHTQARTGGPQMHYFIHAARALTPGQDANIIQYVYLDQQHMPSEIYLQFYTGDGDGERRAYWGEDTVQTGGGRGTPSLYPMGPLPRGGGWVRLQVPADKVGLVGNTINGILYGAYGGQTWWGSTTTSNRLLDNAADRISAPSPAVVLTTTHGAQIAFRLAESARLSITILDKDGQQVRSLSKDVDTQAGYRVVTWDAFDDGGIAVVDAPYTVQFSVGGKVVAERGITITPLVANIQTPGAFSLMRGNQVPVLGEAYGEGFSRYVLEYGDGLNPANWQPIVTSDAPVLLPAGSSLRSFNPGNIANWNVGVDEYRPWKQTGLNGLYTLRLRVIGGDGREASDTLPVIVGHLAHTPESGTITSPDGKAKLIIPALATARPFSLMALLPVSQLEPDGAWRANLPGNGKLLGEIYEVFPADETFRRPATLELPYVGNDPPGQVGVLLGDGTLDGWHYIGGKADPQRGVMSVPVADFGGKRALVAVFAAGSFGPPPADPGAGARPAFSDTLQTPSVVSSTAPFAFSSDLESSPGEWEALDVYGTGLSRVEGSAAGLASGDSALKVTHEAGGERLLRVRSTPYDVNKYPIVSFSYRLPADYAPDLIVRSNGVWWQLRMSATTSADTVYFHSLNAPGLISDGAWHNYRVDLLALLRSAQPGVTDFQADELVLGQFKRLAYMQVAIVDSGETGSAYFIDNFAALRPTNAENLSFSWAAVQATSFSAYSFTLSRDPGTVPPETATSASTQTTVSLPPSAADGLWYFHLRGKSTNGQWGSAVHIPLLIDRQPPQLGRPDPTPGGAGSPDTLQIPLVDEGGVDAASVQLEMAGNVYTWAGVAPKGGLQYDLETGSLLVYRNLLDPRIPEQPSGQKIELAMRGLADYAGNQLAAPFSWSFTADQPEVAGEAAFKQLTSNGGDSPTISPDGSQVAFVSSRSGVERIWIMRSDDYGEKAGSAKLLTGQDSSGRESHPRWSPDGKTLAYVSDATGSTQVWLAASDGSGSHVLTGGEGGASSPDWLGQSMGGDSGAAQTLVFVRDGNLWQVGADGHDLHALTAYPERPVRSVRAQPDGSLLAVGFKLYQQTVELYDPWSRTSESSLQPLTNGGKDKEPAWLNSTTIIYTAPANQDGPDAIWQIPSVAAPGMNGLGGQAAGGGVIFGDSARPGAADMQPDAALDGSSVAIVSTRGGDRNVWLRQALQIASLQVSPSSAVAAGESTQISYTLPTSATATLGIEDGSGKTVRLLLDAAHQGGGAHELAWDGAGSDNKVLAPGDYLVHLSANVGNALLTRRATVRLLEPSDRGTLRLEIQQWSGQAFQSSSDLSVFVYGEGTRARPVAQAHANSNPHFELPSGRYDVLIEYGGARAEARGIVVEGGKEVSRQIDMGLGKLEVTLLMATGQPVAGNALVTLYRSDDPSGMALRDDYSAAPDFLLTPGKYNLKIEFGDITKKIYGLTVRRGEINRQEVSLESGILKLTVYSRDGTLAEQNGPLVVQMFRSQDHSQVVATSYSNPVEMALPEGRYDIRIEYSSVISSEDARLVGGSTISWANGIDIKAGQSSALEQKLKLTPVTVRVVEAQGKAADADKITFQVYPKGEVGSKYVAYAYTDTAHLQLPEGIYEVHVTYENTQLASEGGMGKPLEVKYGQSVDHIINLGLGHIHIDVISQDGRPLDDEEGEGLYAGAAPTDMPDTAFASDRDHNPLDLPVRAGVAYDITVRLGYGKALTLPGQQVKEGEVLNLKVSIQELK